MFKSGKRSWMFLSAASLILWLGRADSQQETQTTAPQNPYLMGSEGYDKGPRGLTSYQPIAIDQPFAARMAADVAAKPAMTSAITPPRASPWSMGSRCRRGCASGCHRE
jgi:hypothetical protein